MVLGFFIFSNTAFADQTGKGKILSTQGHINANCRIVVHKENTTGVVSGFRINNVTADDDVSAAVLTALIANRDTTIFYNPGETTGCGTQPRIVYVTVY